MARGIWPEANNRMEQLLELPKALKISCIHSVLKWGATIHGRASTYQKTQDLFIKNKKVLANAILEGRPIDTFEPAYPPIKDIENLYKTLFETDSAPDAAPINRIKLANNVMSRSILSADVERAKSGWRNSAPGKDGVSVAQVKQGNNDILAIVYNIVLYRNQDRRAG